MSIHARIHNYSNRPARASGNIVVYWMQSAARISHNHALAYAATMAKHTEKTLVIVTTLDLAYPSANDRSWHFLISGWHEVAEHCANNGIPFITMIGDPATTLDTFCAYNRPYAIVTDEGYTPTARKWREDAASKVYAPLTAIDTNMVVPIRFASNKQEWGAHTIRPKIHAAIDHFLHPVSEPILCYHVAGKIELRGLCTIDWSQSVSQIVANISVNHSVKPSPFFEPGEKAAQKTLQTFITDGLTEYADKKNQPGTEHVSRLSPYLHFGHISPIDIALAVKKSNASKTDIDAFLEELIVRRELAHNFVWHETHLNTFESFPAWAKKTLDKHRNDPRPYCYSLEQFEQAKTHDPYWNAAQMEMVKTGHMHGYMRMYWAKKILEWTESPEQAIDFAVLLNDKYELDGRDPNGWVGIAWAIGGLHDRAWVERPIFGTVRYMNADGLKRKIKNINSYVHKWTS